jgi:CopA family copper-resistance protein
MLTRRELLRYTASAGVCLAAQGLLPEWARAASGVQATKGPRTGPHDFDLTIAETPIRIDGRRGTAMALNGTIPGPLMRFTEGETVTIHAHNRLRESTSIHWHGILLPFQMDGVPGVTYPGIAPAETFTYRFTLKQAGTYWYHSHTGLQEQLGLNGPLIVDPRGGEPFAYTREHVVVLTDWMFADPYAILAKLKKESDYSNFQRRTVGDFFHDVSREGLRAALKDRAMWGRMRMAPTDIADVTGHLYTYLMNGQGPVSGWTGLFSPGERVRLRLINASAMTYFNVRVPDLPMTVVLADGQPVEPVTVDELQIAVAETFDVIVEPRERAYTLFAEAMDRSGYARGTLAPRDGMTAPVPALRKPPQRTMIDMGMAPSSTMAGMNTGAGHQLTGGGTQADHAAMTMGGSDGGHEMMAMPGVGPVVARHGPDHHGPGNAAVPEVERNRLGERGTGLADVDHRVLVYTDLQALEPHEPREPDRQIELHLTGNMERYMWSFDGKKFSEVTAPIPFRYGERLRLVLVNDTMMEHPIHLHGMWMNLENGRGARIPRKHTVSVKPAERLSVLVDADAPGRWAFHCHLLFHMEMGMFRVVEVSPYEGELP